MKSGKLLHKRCFVDSQFSTTVIWLCLAQSRIDKASGPIYRYETLRCDACTQVQTYTRTDKREV